MSFGFIRQAAFTGDEHRLLKGALHSHTTRSDGKGSPDEVIRRYHSLGYDFLALTDHRSYNFRNYAPDTDIIILPAMEIDCNIKGGNGIHCFHTVVLGQKGENESPYSQDERFSFDDVASQDEFQPILDRFHSTGHLTLYCHPEWSATPANEFDRLNGNFAIEIWNTGCADENGLDTNAAYWDELLTAGRHIYGCAVDDGHAMRHHGIAAVYVKAGREINEILSALESGAFYSSCGPLINDFYVEGNRAVIDCTDATEIVFRTGRYPCERFSPSLFPYNCDVTPLNHTEYEMPPYLKYIRATITDKFGRRAWTNPLFLD